MESRAKFAGHPVHPMLIVFPLGLLATAVIFDIIYLVSNSSQWTLVAYYMIGAGVIGGAAAAVAGRELAAPCWCGGARRRSMDFSQAFSRVFRRPGGKLEFPARQLCRCRAA